jgi:hypothetical protein
MRKGRDLGLLVLFAVAVLGVACRGGEAPAQETAQQGTPARMPDATIRDLMVTVIDPAADGVWLAVKSETTREGKVVDTAPRNDEEWQTVRRAAMTLIDGADLLMMPGRRVARPGEKSAAPGVELEPAEVERNINADRAAWNMRAQALKDATMDVLAAIDARDAPKVFDLGDELDLACENCHRHFWYPNEQIPEFPSTPPSQP